MLIVHLFSGIVFAVLAALAGGLMAISLWSAVGCYIVGANLGLLASLPVALLRRPKWPQRAAEREARVSAGRQAVTHRATTWSATHTPDQLQAWIAFYEEMATKVGSPTHQADLQVRHTVRSLLAGERGLP